MRPHPRVAVQIAQLLSAVPDPTLLLGVTPELGLIDREIVAVDWNPRMIAMAWPGDTPRRRAIVGDWRSLPLADGSVGSVMSDGAFTMLRWPDDAGQLLRELWRTLRPGGRVVIRCFATPEPFETTLEVCQAAWRGGLTFHAFKLRFNMACARETAEISVACQTLFHRFTEHFPDRNALAEATGWSLETISEIDAYSGSPYVHVYPSRSELTGLLESWPGPWRFEETGSYPLAERCPLLVLTRP